MRNPIVYIGYADQFQDNFMIGFIDEESGKGERFFGTDTSSKTDRSEMKERGLKPVCTMVELQQALMLLREEKYDE